MTYCKYFNRDEINVGVLLCVLASKESPTFFLSFFPAGTYFYTKHSKFILMIVVRGMFVNQTSINDFDFTNT